MKTLIVCLCLPLCLIGPQCPAQGFLNLAFELADTSQAVGGDRLAQSDAIPYWTASDGSGRLTPSVTYNFYLAGPGGQIGLYDGGPGGFYLLPAPLHGLYSVFLGSGHDWPGGGEGSGDEFISQTGQVSTFANSIWFMTSNGGLLPGWDAPYELILSLGGQRIPYIEVARDDTSITYAASVSSFAGDIVELRFYLHNLAAAPDGGILLGLDNIYFSSQIVPEPSSLTLVGASMVTLAVVRCRRRFLN